MTGPLSPATAAARPHPSRSRTSGSARSSGLTRPCYTEQRPRCRGPGGSPRSPAAAAGARRAAGRPRTGSTRSLVQRLVRPAVLGRLEPCPGRTPAAHVAGVARACSPMPDTAARHADRQRGRLPAHRLGALDRAAVTTRTCQALRAGARRRPCARCRASWSPRWPHAAGAGAGPLAVVPCDNSPGQRPGGDAGWCSTSPTPWIYLAWPAWVRCARSRSSTPRSTASRRARPRPDIDGRRQAHRRPRRCAVVTEPFTRVGARRRVPRRPPRLGARRRPVRRRRRRPTSERKLSLLNGSHSLLAYAGSYPRAPHRPRRDLPTPSCRGWVEAPHALRLVPHFRGAGARVRRGRCHDES